MYPSETAEAKAAAANARGLEKSLYGNAAILVRGRRLRRFGQHVVHRRHAAPKRRQLAQFTLRWNVCGAANQWFPAPYRDRGRYGPSAGAGRLGAATSAVPSAACTPRKTHSSLSVNTPS